MSMHDALLPSHSCTETQLLVASQLYIILALSILIFLGTASKRYYNNIVNVHTLIDKGAI